MENPKQYRMLTDAVFSHPWSGGNMNIRREMVVEFNGYESHSVALVRYTSPLSGREYSALIAKQYLEELGTRPPVDRSAWREGIDQVQGYLPAMSGLDWDALQRHHRPLYEGLRKMHENGPDND